MESNDVRFKWFNKPEIFANFQFIFIIEAKEFSAKQKESQKKKSIFLETKNIHRLTRIWDYARFVRDSPQNRYSVGFHVCWSLLIFSTK